MSLTFGPDRQTLTFACECCQADIDRSWNIVHAGGAPYALYCANCYHHRDQDHDVWIDVVFGTWGDGMDDHVSFGCRVGPVPGQGDDLPGRTALRAQTGPPGGAGAPAAAGVLVGRGLRSRERSAGQRAPVRHAVSGRPRGPVQPPEGRGFAGA